MWDQMHVKFKLVNNKTVTWIPETHFDTVFKSLCIMIKTIQTGSKYSNKF